MAADPKASTEADELTQIMSEIDQLHQEMHDESSSNVVPFTGSAAEPETTPERTPLSFLDEVSEEAGGEPIEAQMLDETTSPSKVNPSEDGTLTMSLTGKMKLNLRYDFESWQVQIGFNEDALVVKLSDGTEFKIPVRKKS